MPYLIDTSALIQAKNLFYQFSFCPGFWDWILREHEREVVYSTDRVLQEILAGSDELSNWAKAAPKSFFLSTTQDIASKQSMVARWVQSNSQYRPEAKVTFLQGADPWLVAHAAETGFTLITHEVSAPGAQRIVPLPDVCRQFGVECCLLYDALNQTGTKLKL